MRQMLLTLGVLCLIGGTAYADDETTLKSQLIVQDGDTVPTCATATGAGDICASDAIEANGALDVAGAVSLGSTLALTGDLTLSGGAGALTFDDSASSIVIPDNDATALLLGSTGYLGLLTFDTTNDAEEVNVVGKTAVSVFRVDTGFATFDEQAVLTSGANSDGDLLLGGGAGALQFDAASSSVLTTDNSGTGLLIGSTGQLGLITLDTTDSNEEVNIVGTTATSSFRVDTGFATFDEQAVLSAGADSNDDVLLGGGAGALQFDAASSSILTTDNSGTGLLIGSTGMLGLITLDTTDSNEEVNIVGTTATSSFRVDTGFATFDEQAVLSAGADSNDDILLGGGAGALQFDAASSSILTTDNSATGLLIGSTDQLGLITLDTSDGAEEVNIVGTTTQNSFRVDVGDALFDEDVTVSGGLGVVAQTIEISFSDMRVFDNPAALLPAAGATDDLGIVLGTPGTNQVSLQTEDLKAEGGNPTLNKAMFYWVVPPTYVAGSTVTVRINGGMTTTISDDAATVDVECWVPDYANADGSVSSDLIGTAAQDINSVTFGNDDFTLDDDLSGHELAAGSVVQCIVTTSVSDGATGTAVIATIRRVQILIST